jgi:prevent-host-death family protein
MDTVNIYEAKTQLSALVERAATGEEIIIARNGRAVARLVPLAKRTAPRPLGRFKGQFDVGEDFGAALPDTIIKAFPGETE